MVLQPNMECLFSMFVVPEITNLVYFSSFPECKLSRTGPPATIVAIDEESPNGRYRSTCTNKALQFASTTPLLHLMLEKKHQQKKTFSFHSVIIQAN